MKKLSAFLLSLVLMLSLMPIVSAESTASTAIPPTIPTTGDVWDGYIEAPTKIVRKDDVNYYEITKCSQLAFVAQTGGEWLGRNYLLANNLILNDVVLKWDEDGNLLNNPTNLHEWAPIGSRSTPFTGRFEGCGYIVSGLYISQTSSYVGLFSDCKEMVYNLAVVNAYVSGSSYVGGIIGHAHGTSGCIFSGIVKGYYNVGGISGTESNTNHCINYGTVIGVNNVGGIGNHEYYNGMNGTSYCINYGSITGTSKVGGIEGNGSGYHCANYGLITGNGDYVGGIAGDGHGFRSVNYAAVSGKNSVGGISGKGSASNSYNVANITGSGNVGGITGSNNSSATKQCYNIGIVNCTVDENNVGAIVGSDSAIWSKDSWGDDLIQSCYYIKTASINYNLFGCGGVSSADLEPEGLFCKNSSELKQQSTYAGWDFGETWRINPKYNDGYPYLAWEHADDAPPLDGISLSQMSLELSEGDSGYLTASPVPADAEAVSLSWQSDKTGVATVNSNGRVIAVGPGTATITVSGGGFSAACIITVTGRQTEEYRLGTLTIRDANGAALSSIPNSQFFVTVPITKLTAGGNTMIMLASYSASGQFKSLLYVSVEDFPVGATVKVTLPVDNSKGDIALLKAFTIASFSNPVPIGAAVSFPAQ